MSDLDDKTVARFWSKVNKNGPVHPTLGTPCWSWTSTIDRDGYGRSNSKVRFGTRMAHRISWMLSNGPIPNGLTIDHLCRVRNCVNPMHLEPTTNRENSLRGIGPGAINARKTHCIHGHELPEARISCGRIKRRCLECNRRICLDYWRRNPRPSNRTKATDQQRDMSR